MGKPRPDNMWFETRAEEAQPKTVRLWSLDQETFVLHDLANEEAWIKMEIDEDSLRCYNRP